MALHQNKTSLSKPITDGLLASQLMSILGMMNFNVVVGRTVITIMLSGSNFSVC
jgi:hypothetical protein